MPLKKRRSKVAAPPEPCALTECMSFLKGAWAPNVIWYLKGGARRFSELRSDIPFVSARVLSARLRELEKRGLIVRTVMPTSPPTVEYALTALGQELIPALDALVEVGHKLKLAERARYRTAQPENMSHESPS